MQTTARHDGLKKTKTVSDDMGDGSVNDDSTAVVYYALSFTLCL